MIIYTVGSSLHVYTVTETVQQNCHIHSWENNKKEFLNLFIFGFSTFYLGILIHHFEVTACNKYLTPIVL